MPPRWTRRLKNSGWDYGGRVWKPPGWNKSKAEKPRSTLHGPDPDEWGGGKPKYS